MRLKASLRFFDSTLDANLLAKDLALTPSVVHLKGQKRTTPKGAPLEGTYDRNYCVFPLDVEGQTLLSDYLEVFASRFEPNKTLFHEVRGTNGRVELYVSLLEADRVGDVLRGDLMQSLGQLEVDLAFESYPSTERKED